MLKKIFKFLFVLLILIQFYRPARNIQANAQTANISTVFGMPENVKSIFNKACNDCHSNNTVYPWYAQIQPISYWLTSHVNEGKQHLNMDSFGAYSLRKQFHKLEEINDEVNESKNMPLNSYTWMHSNAKLSDAERKVIGDWVIGLQDSLKLVYPIDSLIKQKK